MLENIVLKPSMLADFRKASTKLAANFTVVRVVQNLMNVVDAVMGDVG